VPLTYRPLAKLAEVIYLAARRPPSPQWGSEQGRSLPASPGCCGVLIAVPFGAPRRRSTSAEIQEVRRMEERRR
jgi:hypothetical protein